MKWMILLMLLAGPVGASPIWTGFVDLGKGERRFALSDSETGGAVWLRVGESFGGYRLAEFDPTEGVLLLQRDPDRVRLKLNTGTIVDDKDAAFQRGLVDAAKTMLAKFDRWEPSSVVFSAPHKGRERWFVYATRIEQGQIESRGFVFTFDGKLSNYQVLTPKPAPTSENGR